MECGVRVLLQCGAPMVLRPQDGWELRGGGQAPLAACFVVEAVQVRWRSCAVRSFPPAPYTCRRPLQLPVVLIWGVLRICRLPVQACTTAESQWCGQTSPPFHKRRDTKS